MLAQDIFGAQQPLIPFSGKRLASDTFLDPLNFLSVLSHIAASPDPRLAELFYMLDEEGGIVSQQRAAALLALAPGCGEAWHLLPKHPRSSKS